MSESKPEPIVNQHDGEPRPRLDVDEILRRSVPEPRDLTPAERKGVASRKVFVVDKRR